MSEKDSMKDVVFLKFSLNKLLKNNALKNGIWLYLLQCFNTVMPMLTLPYITRVVGAEYYGVFNSSLNVIAYFQTVVEYGFGMSASRKVVLSGNDEEKVNKLFNTVVFSRFFLLLCCSSVEGIICILSKDLRKVICTLILFTSLIGYSIQQNWLFQGKQEMKYISVVNIIARSVSTLLIFIFVKSRSDIFVYCALFSVSPLLSGLIGLLIAHHRYHLSFIRIDATELKEGLKDGWYVFTTQFSAKVLNIVGITFLGWFASSFQVGVYSAINKLSNIVVLVWNPISQVLYPISSRKLSESFQRGLFFIQKVRKCLLLIFGFGICVGIALSKWLVRVAFGSEFAPYYYQLIPQLVFVLVAINNNFWGLQIMLGGGYDKEYSRCFQISVVATVLTNLILIFLWGMNGAAFCNLLSEGFLSVLLFFSIKKIKHERAVQ